MSLIAFILDIAALLLWLNWRAVKLDPLARATPATLAGTLRRAEPSRVRRWHFVAVLVVLIFLRAIIYRVLGPALHWTGQLDLVATRVSFPSDFLEWMFLFSVLSFALTLFAYYVLLILVSFLATSRNGEFMMPILAREHLGAVDSLPKLIRILLPLFCGGALWWLASWPLSAWDLIPRPVSELTRLAQAGLVGLGSYIVWKYFLVALLALHLLNNHIYFGAHPIWNYVTATAQRVLTLFKWLPLRLGKVDFTPLAGIALVLLIAQIAERGLPLWGGYRILGLPELYLSLMR